MTESSDTPSPNVFDETNEVPERALRIYARLWQFETWLRQMVYVELRALKGDDWSAEIKGNAKAFAGDKYLKHMPTPEMHALSLSPLSQLTGLVKANWNCFEPYLPPQDLWNAKLSEISQIRHRCAHFRSGHADDYSRLRQFLRDIDRGFWTFCTSYNNAYPVLPQSCDAVTENYLHLDPIPFSEVEPHHWAQVGHVDRSPVIGMNVRVQRRPWANSVAKADGEAGYLYDITLFANDRIFDYPKLLEATKHLHPHFVHVILDGHEGSIRLTLPTILGSAKVIDLLDEFLKLAIYAVSRVRNPELQTATIRELQHLVAGARSLDFRIVELVERHLGSQLSARSTLPVPTSIGDTMNHTNKCAGFQQRSMERNRVNNAQNAGILEANGY